VVLDECDALEDSRTPSAVSTPLPDGWETTSMATSSVLIRVGCSAAVAAAVVVVVVVVVNACIWFGPAACEDDDNAATPFNSALSTSLRDHQAIMPRPCSSMDPCTVKRGRNTSAGVDASGAVMTTSLGGRIPVAGIGCVATGRGCGGKGGGAGRMVGGIGCC